MTNRSAPAAVAAVLAGFPLAARGLINVHFTPVQLVEQSGTILLAKVAGKAVAAGKTVTLEVTASLKGTAAAATATVDLSGAPGEHADAARKELAACAADGGCVLLFADKPRGKAATAGFLHVNGLWLRISRREAGWKLLAVDQSMPGTWAGGTDMLARCVRYILAEGRGASVPSVPGTAWRRTARIGAVDGKASDIAAVDLGGSTRSCCLFIAAPKGDRLLHAGKDGAFEDITAEVKLGSRSTLAAWGDFNGDGRADLASCDGQAVTIWTQAADGTFGSASAGGANLVVPPGCVALAATTAGPGAMSGLLLSPAAGAPVLWKPAASGTFAPAVLPAAAAAAGGGDRGKAQPCLVADFDGDSFVDVVQPFEKGGLLYLGGRNGPAAAAPRPCSVCTTVGGGRAALGDFDGDGLPDVLVAGAEGVRIFQNLGGGRFRESLAVSGEVACKAQPLASWCGTCDFNSDCRADLLLAYPAQSMQMYFNRGFRSFGEAPKLESALEEIDGFSRGQQMATFADLTGGGAQDLFLVTSEGEIWCATNDLGADGDGLCVKPRLPAPAAATGPGPLSVSLWGKGRCLGSVIVRAGAAPGFFGLMNPGKYTLKWRPPGAAAGAADDVVVKDGAVTVTLGEAH